MLAPRTMADPSPPSIRVGDEFVVHALRIAHGGHCIAHHEGRTVFVRHTLPGEQVRVRVTDVSRKIVRADAFEILQPSEDRVVAPCRWAGPDACGGCDFQHVRIATQRALKTEVLNTSLVRFGGVAPDDPVVSTATVEELPGFSDGLRWRSRITWSTDDSGRTGLRKYRSHEVVPVDHCLIADAQIDQPQGQVHARHTRKVRHRTWVMPRDTFWQVHPALPEALVDTMLTFGQPQLQERWWDLYAGAGLLAAFLGEAVGPGGAVDAVEDDSGAVALAVTSLADLPWVTPQRADVRRWLRSQEPKGGVDGIVLDPPRSGAGPELMAALVARRPQRIVYVACDPVALARDVRAAGEAGFSLTRIRAFDAFPMTHHFETVALLEPRRT